MKLPKNATPAPFTGNDIFWFVNGISYICAMYQQLGLEAKAWIDFRDDKFRFDSEVGAAMLEGMATAASQPDAVKIGIVMKFMEGMGIEFHLHGMEKKFDA